MFIFYLKKLLMMGLTLELDDVYRIDESGVVTELIRT